MVSAVVSRAVVVESFGGPQVLQVREVPEPHAGPGQLRVKVTAAGLNPVDWIIVASAEMAGLFGVSLPSGFGNDYAGVVDEVGDEVAGFVAGDRVYGGAQGRAAADYVLVDPAQVYRTPAGVDDVTASTLPVAATTAQAALTAAGAGAGDTLLIGGAAGGVGVFAVQLARLAGARVIGTASAGSAAFLRELGAEPVAYGDGLAERVRALAPDGITAASDLFGTETAYAALELGVPAARISTIAARDPGLAARGVKATGGGNAAPGTLEHIAGLISAGRLTVPVAARFPVEQVRDAVTLQAGRHVRGKLVVTF
jgi:NADPH:quinone reductase-like Zn-dependent oxidoreductase